jgi:hypothetical protein
VISGIAAQVSRLEKRTVVARAVIGLDVDEADHAFLDLLPGTLQSRADVLELFDKFGVSARGLGHLVVACVAEIAGGLVALGVGGPAAIKADHAQQRQFVPHRGVELHCVLPEPPVAVQADELRVGLRRVGADRKEERSVTHPLAEVNPRTRVSQLTRRVGIHHV